MPHWLAPWEIARDNRREMKLFPRMTGGETAEKKCQKSVNTREKEPAHASTSFWLQSAAHARSHVLSGDIGCCSFSPVKVSQKCSQLIHTRVIRVLASGLETRNRFENRQEKNELYFFIM